MSRLFEALQRSEPGLSFEFPQATSLANEVLQTVKADADELGQFPSLQISVSPNSRLVSLMGEGSLGAEQFRFLGVRLRQLQRARPLKKILITSTIPGEGKSMVSGNLAVVLAGKKQNKILLLEGDLRRPVLAQRFGLGNLAGLSEQLQGTSSAAPNIYHLEEPGFWFLPAGSPPENPLELMQSGRLSELLDQLSARFDWIVIDSPPLLPLADTSVWMRFADSVLLVTREGKTEKRQLQRGLQVLNQSNLVGVVLNSCTNADHSSYYQAYLPVAAGPRAKLGSKNSTPPRSTPRYLKC